MFRVRSPGASGNPLLSTASSAVGGLSPATTPCGDQRLRPLDCPYIEGCLLMFRESDLGSIGTSGLRSAGCGDA